MIGWLVGRLVGRREDSTRDDGGETALLSSIDYACEQAENASGRSTWEIYSARKRGGCASRGRSYQLKKAITKAISGKKTLRDTRSDVIVHDRTRSASIGLQCKRLSYCLHCSLLSRASVYYACELHGGREGRRTQRKAQLSIDTMETTDLEITIARIGRTTTSHDIIGKTMR